MKKNNTTKIIMFILFIIMVAASTFKPLDFLVPICEISIIALLVISIIVTFSQKHYVWENGKDKNTYRILNDRTLKTLGIENKQETIEELQDLFINFFNTSIQGNIKELKKYSSDISFNKTKDYIENINQKVSLSNLEFIDSKIFEAQITHDITKIYILFKINYELIIDKNKSIKNTIFECVFKCDNTKELLDNCPNCGAPLKKISNHQCDFCNQKIYNKNWKLIEIEEITYNIEEVYE